jgi:zeaxanthin glucosyltransferase
VQNDQASRTALLIAASLVLLHRDPKHSRLVGFVGLPLSGHLNPMTALARKLQSHGHEVQFIGVPDVEPIVRAANLTFEPYCAKEYPLGSIAELYAPIAELHGLDVMRYQTQQITPRFLKAALEHLPEKLKETGVKALVLDATHVFLQLAPMSLGIPFVQIWNTFHLDSSGATPASPSFAVSTI